VVMVLEAPTPSRSGATRWARRIRERGEGTIRKRFATASSATACTGSDAPETAAVEIPFFFSATEHLVRLLEARLKLHSVHATTRTSLPVPPARTIPRPSIRRARRHFTRRGERGPRLAISLSNPSSPISALLRLAPQSKVSRKHRDQGEGNRHR
jgi:hypothetical protein